MRSAKGDVALHEAVASGRKDLVLWILRQSQQYGDPAAPVGPAHVVNNDGRSPLHIAAINNNVEMCKVIYNHGLLIRAGTRSGHWSVIRRA